MPEPHDAIPAAADVIHPHLWPAGAKRAGDGELTLAGHRVSRLLAEFGSPLYVIDESDFRARAAAFAAAFSGWDVYYAGKAFLCKAVVRWVDEAGLSLDVCSGGELAVALAAGFPPGRIELHGNNKSEGEIAYAMDVGVGRIIADSFDEIARIERLAGERGTRARVLVRVTTGVTAHTHEYIATSHEDQKFGFSIQSGQAMAALLACHEAAHIDCAGLHSHIGSQILDTGGFEVAAGRLAGLAADFLERTGAGLPEVNLGGGFGIAYTPADTALTPAELRAVLSQTPLAGRLAIEPGRAIAGPAGVALYTVGTVKPVEYATGHTRLYVSVDGGMSDNIRPALYGADYHAVLAGRTSGCEPRLARVVGKHCESGDILVRDVTLPSDVRPGDILAVPAAGAYTRSMASNYNHAARPAVVAVTPGEARIILRRETPEDLMATDVG